MDMVSGLQSRARSSRAMVDGWSQMTAPGVGLGSNLRCRWRRRMRTDPVVHIVDDDEAVRDSLEMLLRVLGFTVKTWASPVAFLASEAAREPGCLLVDIR